MEEIILPHKIEYKKDSEDIYKVILTVEPCFPGFGVTLGNALRRVLLSSLSGGAVTAFKIKGVHHEFSTLTGMLEDMIELIMNLKNLRFHIFSDEPIRLYISAHGECEVTAKDIEPNAAVQIINKDHKIATLTKKDAKLEMELIVEKGRGYRASEGRGEDSPEVDLITIDAIFNPVRVVGYSIENVRVGQMTDFERLILHVETDGSIIPEDAIKEAVNVLVNQFKILLNDDKIFETENSKEPHFSITENYKNDEMTEKIEEKSEKKKAGRPKKKQI